jgi:adenosylcobinamide-GDP ribazoletransferase
MRASLAGLALALRAFRAALAFMTCVPVGSSAIDARDLGRSIGFFPAVGTLLGLCLLGAATALRGRLDPDLLAVLLIALLAALTAGLHLDGLADVFDGLAGGRGDPARVLAIMRDSRIGAGGAVALFLHLTAKLLAVSILLQRGTLWPLLAAPVVARGGAALLIFAFPYARAQGLGRAFADHRRTSDLVLTTVIAGAVLVPVGPECIRPTLFALACTLACSALLNRRIGGLTGDAYGAAIELAELAFWIAATQSCLDGRAA